MTTIAELNAHLDLTVLDHLDAQADVPVDTTVAPQGDLLLVPAALDPHVNPTGSWDPIPVEGLVLISGTHDHTLYGHGRYTPAQDRSGCAFMLVELDGDAAVHHIEHGYRRPAQGRWVARRQQEGAEERRRAVVD